MDEENYGSILHRLRAIVRRLNTISEEKQLKISRLFQQQDINALLDDIDKLRAYVNVLEKMFYE